jgi:hypothetical protein
MSHNKKSENNYTNPLIGITKFFSQFLPSSWNENGKNVGQKRSFKQIENRDLS